MLGSVAYWISLVLVIAPLMIAVCALCWGLVVSIPMAKLTWELLVHLFTRPLALGFRHAPKVVVPAAGEDPGAGGQEGNVATNRTSPASDGSDPAVKRTPFLRPGQASPRAGPRSTVLLCTYRAVGMQYFKYTVGGVNIIFVDLMPLVFFVIFDGWFLLPYSEHRDLGPFWNFITSQVVVFVMALASVIPLSYFIGMAVASISAQSSIGTGAVINATFGSVIEIVLYAIALTQGKGRLVEGSIVGSLLAGVLLMPGVSMVSGALKRKEQKFNAKSAGVTSTMLIMAIIGILTPTLFYQAYGSVRLLFSPSPFSLERRKLRMLWPSLSFLQFELSCTGCPSDSTPNPNPSGNQPWMCKSCRYSHPDPAGDPFYQEKVKHLMYFCAFILTFVSSLSLFTTHLLHVSSIANEFPLAFSVLSHRSLVLTPNARFSDLVKPSTAPPPGTSQHRRSSPRPPSLDPRPSASRRRPQPSSNRSRSPDLRQANSPPSRLVRRRC
jgi:Ca2+:H+ antiporter